MIGGEDDTLAHLPMIVIGGGATQGLLTDTDAPLLQEEGIV